MASPMPAFERRAYPHSWPMPVRLPVAPVPGLQTRNTDIDARRAQLVWTPRVAA